jgi:phosphopantothenoylcysteine decarboxylase/phosphopantothenate--cysteine ligase
MDLNGKHVVLGVSGGISAYKSATLCRLLVKSGADVRVVMTKNATEFVGPLTFETLSGHVVGLDMFGPRKSDGVVHIEWAEWADLAVIAPATANIIAKTATGIADDLLSTLLLAVQCPVVFTPAMHHQMWGNSIVQRNVTTLGDLGYHIVPPNEGALASGGTGPGRLPEPEEIMDFIQNI